MEYDKNYIRKLIGLYEEGETSLDQEKELKAYFSSKDYDREFEDYALLFRFFKQESTAKADQIPQPKTKPSNYFWINIAASICIVLGGLWFYEYYDHQQDLEKARQAFETTQTALNLLSHNMNEGLEKLEYIEVFSQQKNKILK